MQVQNQMKENRLDLVIQVRWVIMEYILKSMTWILWCTFWNETYSTQPQGEPLRVKYSRFMSALHIPVDTAHKVFGLHINQQIMYLQESTDSICDHRC